MKRILSKFQKIFTKKGIVNVFLSLNNFISRLNNNIHYKNMLSKKQIKKGFQKFIERISGRAMSLEAERALKFYILKIFEIGF